MSEYDLSKLRAKQDKLEARKAGLMQSFIPFRDGLIEGLKLFTEEAVTAGLHGVKLLKREKDSQGLIEATFALNSFDLLLVVTEDAHFLNPQENTDFETFPRSVLASRILFYIQGSDDSTPIAEIVVTETNGDIYVYRAAMFMVKGPDYFAAGRAPNYEEGRKVATALANYLYSFVHFWLRKPTLRAARARTSSETKLIGFIHGDRSEAG